MAGIVSGALTTAVVLPFAELPGEIVAAFWVAVEEGKLTMVVQMSSILFGDTMVPNNGESNGKENGK